MKEDFTNDFLRDTLNNHESAVPQDMWARIERARQPQPTTTAWWKLCALAVPVVVVLASAWWMQSKQENPNSSMQPATLVTTPIADVAATTNMGSSATPTTSVNSIAKVANTHNINSDIQESNTTAPNQSVNTFEKATDKANNTIDANIDNNITTQVNDNIAISNIDANIDTKESTKPSIIGIGKNSALPGIGLRIPTTTNSMVQKALSLRNLKSPFVECANFGKKPNNIYLELFASPDVAFRSLNVNDGKEEYQTFADARNATEKSRYAYTIGGRVSVILKNGLAFRVGATYHQINEKFEWQDPNATQSTSIGISIDTLVVGMDTTFVIDTLFATVNGLRVKKTYNQYKMIDFPFIVGYEMNNGGNWTFSVNAGVYVSVYAWQKGDALNEVLEPQTFTTEVFQAQKIFKPSVGLSLFSSVGAYYQFSKKFSLLIEPHFRYFFKPITEDTYLLRQRYTNAGVMLGIRYKF